MSAAEDNSTPGERSRVGVVIINYRTADLTIGCLESLVGEVEPNDGRVAVVDNYSDDGSADAIEAWIKQSPLAAYATLIRSPVNSGFSGGCNQGMRALDADFYLMLNSDARLRPGALGEILAAAARHPKAGAIAPRLEFEDGAPQQSCFRHHSPMSELSSAARWAPITKLLSRYEIAPPVSDTPFECDWASFACILLRREAVDAVGEMDEGYFMYFEDSDYCHALAKAGWRVVYDPSTHVVHLRGGSSPVKAAHQQRARPPAYYYASRTRYFRKRYGVMGPYAANAMWMLGRVFARLRPLTGKDFRPACDNQLADIWTNWRRPLGDRRAPAGS